MEKRTKTNVLKHNEIPPKIFHALNLRAGGASWSDCAAATGCHLATLRKYRKYPECISFLEAQIKESLNTAHIKLLDAAPRVANELLKVALDPKTKAYAKVSACESIFRITQVGIQDTEMRQKLESIKEQLSVLEKGGPTVVNV